MGSGTSEVAPSAGRLITSLRDIGYDLSGAIADLTDNSIAAGATTVTVDAEFDGRLSWVRVADDGVGMSDRRLEEAMRFGTRRAYQAADLGRFGLGMKLAALSQCRCLTVATRTTERGRIRIAQWDLDHVEQRDRWEVFRFTSGMVSGLVLDPIRGHRGTVVVLEDFDRLARFHVPDGKRARAGFDQMMADLRQNLEMTFHRFLAGEARRQIPLAITLNGDQLTAWDPFCRSERETLELAPQVLQFEDDPRSGRVTVRPYLLPAEAAFSNREAHARAAGPKRWNNQQGFYFYRSDRLLQAGGWNRLRTADEHSKLARIAVDLPIGSDSAFSVNVTKSQVRIPTRLRRDLSAIASAVSEQAQRSYRAASDGSGEPAAEADEQRLRSAELLVGLVMAGCESILRDELDDDPALLQRLLTRYERMRARFAQDLVQRAGARARGRDRVVEGTTSGDQGRAVSPSSIAS